jgi:KRAB domain-containing zinc finger protein
MMKRLSEEQILALTKPHSDQSHRQHLESAEFLQQNAADLHSTPMPAIFKCDFEQCNLFFSSSAGLEKHRKVHLPALSCNECGRLFRLKRVLLLHVQRHFQLRPYVCDVPGCTYLAKVHDDLKSHKKKVHPSILYKCRKCGKSIKSQSFYMQHMIKHDTDTPPGVIKCIYEGCQLMFKYVEIMRKHFIKAHTSVKKLTKCSNGLSEKQSHSCDDLRKLAEETHKNVKQFQCNECGKCFAFKRILATHIVTHWHWRPFKCVIPGCSFSAKSSYHLQRHKNRVHTLERFTCSLCGKMFKSRDWFKLHEENHKTSTPGVLKCLHVGCQEIFSTSSDLVAHMKRHILRQNVFQVNSNEFTCQLCGKILKSGARNYFKKHLESHNTDTPGVMKCIFWGCKQTFTSATDLKQHAFKHWDASLRPFACDFPQCNFASKLNKDLLKHKSHVHSSNLYTCDMCGKQFKHLSNVAQHFRKFHKIQQSEENPSLNVERPKNSEEKQELIFKCEIEEVVFD